MPVRQKDDASEVVVIGAACLDIKGRVGGAGDVIMGTSNPGDVRISAGGCARNIAENLARLGMSVSLLSVVCADDFGTAIVQHTERAGVDTDHMLMSCDHRSAAYIALLGGDGELLMGIDDTITVGELTPAYIERHTTMLQSARMVVLDANVPLASAALVRTICAAAGVPLTLDPVAYAPALRYRPIIGAFALITPNLIEAEVLSEMPISDVTGGILAAKHLLALGVGTVIITMADRGLVYATGATSGHVPAIPIEIIDPTGAGDALTAVVVYGMLNGIPVDEAVRLGVSAATLTLESTETVRHDLTLDQLYAQMVI